MATNNAINNTLPTPFTVGATSVTSTGTQLNYLNGLTAVPINKINVQAITATGAFTYTPTTGTQYAIFELQGAGGGSGGSTGAASQGAVGAGGGGGAYQKILVIGTTNLGAITGSVGAGGTAGSAGNNAGGVGGSTTLVINSGSTWTSAGGNGGPGQASSALAQVSSQQSGGVNTSGTNATLLFGVAGGYNSFGIVQAAGATGNGFGSAGGTSFLSQKSSPLGSALAGQNYGGGGGGAVNATAGSLAGAVGAQGIVIVTEFISA